MKTINKKIRAVWGVSEIGFSLTATMETAFFLFFLTDVAQLPLAISGIIAGGSGLVDAIAALVAGVVLEKARFKKGKYRPWLMWAPLIAMVFFILSFTKIGGNVTAGIIIGIAYIISHFCWNLAFTANRSLTNVITDAPSERAFLSGRLGAGMALGRVLASGMVPWLTAALTTLVSGVSAYSITAGILSILYIICYGIHYAVTAGYEDEESGPAKKVVTFKDMGRNIVGNKYLILVVIHDIIRLIAYYIVASSAAYYCRVVLNSPTSSGTLLMVFYLGCFIGSLLAARTAKRFGTKTTTFAGIIGWIVLWIIAYLAPANFILLCVLLFVSQVSFGLAYGLTANLYSMCGTYSYWKTGENTIGVTMSFLTLSIKLGVALRGIIVPAFLGYIAYNASATVFDAAAQSGISALYFLLPVALLVVSLIPLAFFRIKDSDIVKWNEEIQQREAQKSA